MNLKEFRINNVSEECFNLLLNRTDLYLMDQDALNIVCQGKVYFLPDKWNYEWMRLLSQESEAELTEMPSVIHYTTPKKPWHYPEELLADVFWKYARDSIFYEEILKKSQLEIAKNVMRTTGFTNIAVYGAGYIGKSYVSKMLEMKLCHIVLWVDKNFANMQGTVIPVEDVGKIYSVSFDYVVIAIENQSVYEEVRKMFISNGIPEEKIMHIYYKV
jgi:hypothetical protein